MGTRRHGATRLAALQPRADVYSLGCILWEMLAGEPLFEGEDASRTAQLVRAASVRSVPDAPPKLDAIVRKALAKDVDARYQTARELGAALADYLSSLPSGGQAGV